MKDMYCPNVCVIVLIYNALPYTRCTIESLFQNTDIPYGLLLVDNGSDERTANYIDKIKPAASCKTVTVLRFDCNLGAMPALNRAYAVARNMNPDFICKCDNDLYFFDDWLDNMVTNISRRDVGAITPLRISKYTRHYRGINSKRVLDELPDVLDGKPESEMMHFFAPYRPDEGARELIKINGGGLHVFSGIPASMPGHCMLIRSDVLDSIGFLADERYRMYGTDDIDLCWEIQRFGYKIAIDRDCYIHHFRHKSISASKERGEILKYNNNEFLRKWSGEVGMLMRRPDFYSNLGDMHNEE